MYHPRQRFAGREIARAITLQSTRAEDLTDTIDDFNYDQIAVLKKRVNFFLSKVKSSRQLPSKGVQIILTCSKKYI